MRRVGSALSCAAWLALAGFAVADTTIDSSNKWAWSGSTGWINCRTDVTNGARIGEYFCSGYFWSSATGWINLGDGTPTNGVRYTNADSSDFGVNHDGKGNLSGYAWSGSYGWIYFEHSYTSDWPRINMTNGMFRGYVWNPSTGWISFDNLQGKLQTEELADTDADGDGISDAWELTNLGSTNVAGGGSADADGDGVTDYYEYIAGTDPTDSNNVFNTVSAARPDTTNLQLLWGTGSNRYYRVLYTTNLLGSSWSTYNTYYSTGDAYVVSIPANRTNAFYKIKALIPPLD